MMRCRACVHTQRRHIDRALVVGTSERSIAEQFGLSASCVNRHRQHIIALVRNAEILSAQTLRDEVRAVVRRVHQLRAQAEYEGNLKLALRAIDSSLKGLELLARISGQLRGEVQVQVAVNAAPRMTEAEVLAEIAATEQQLRVLGALETIRGDER
ncbi:hypothetical protein Acid345_2065 [Candidatus Koribacter versatilis Ellin345]|uniref:Uncharacterized protein n=1 Tax=Koribacter versatilis (strain Ellin345) TaxID=204669 RepID=Q1IPY4_KORVE|nr:hypothetical protein [Candidatus Koribacter versatilis]ABF41066.1 hypothetical protein Acid345_2065 [Candidatus Koribacter versatilis Ellin345]